MNTQTTEIKHFSEMKQSPYLSSFDTTPEGENVTISGYDKVKVKRDDGEAEVYAVFFEEKGKGMILNVVNRNTLISLFGEEVKNSIGQKVCLYYKDDIEFAGKLVHGLRIKKAKIETLTF